MFSASTPTELEHELESMLPLWLIILISTFLIVIPSISFFVFVRMRKIWNRDKIS